MPKDRKDTTADGAPTTQDMTAVSADDEATRIDPPPVPKRVVLTKEDDDEATRTTGVPKKARAAQKMLEDSRRLNAAGGPKPVRRKLHPLIPIGVALVLLVAALAFLNWMIVPTLLPNGAPGPSRLKTLFDW
jgi:hypothetical protein